MSVRLFCPHCGFPLNLNDDCSGQSTTCTSCGGTFVAPAPRVAASPASSGATPQAGSVTLADVEAAQARVTDLMAENVGLAVELSRRKRERQKLAAMLGTLRRMDEGREMLDHTLGRVGGFFVAITVGGAVLVILCSPFSPGALGYFLAVLIGSGLTGLAYLIAAFYPDDAKLAEAIGPLTVRFHEAASRYDQQAAIESAQRQKLLAAESELHRLTAAIDSRLHWLRTCLWEQMTAANFENFLAQVFTHLGYIVEPTGKTGDQGVDLIVSRDARRVAVQAKGYLNQSVGNDAVQQAHAGMSFYNCHAAAVVTNATFTPSARALAERLSCRLIDGSQIRDLIEGVLKL